METGIAFEFLGFAALCTVVASVVPAILSTHPRHALATWFPFVGIKLAIALPLLVPLYLFFFPAYDGNATFEQIAEFRSLGFLGALGELGLGRGTRNMVAWTGALDSIFGLTFLQLHAAAASFGIMGCAIFVFARERAWGARATAWDFAGICLIPSIFLFSSMLLKEPLCLFFLALLFWAVASGPTSVSLMEALSIATVGGIGLLGLALFRPYVFMVAAVAAFMAVGIFGVQKAPGKFRLGVALGLLFCGFLAVKVGWGHVVHITRPDMVQTDAGAVIETLSEIRRKMAGGGSAFALLPVAGLQDWPALAFNTVAVSLKPFPWEGSNIMGFLAGLESLLFFSALVFTAWNIRLAPWLLRRPDFLFAVVMVVGLITEFALFSGNSGTLFRQRTMVIPFVLHLVWCIQRRKESDAVI